MLGLVMLASAHEVRVEPRGDGIGFAIAPEAGWALSDGGLGACWELTFQARKLGTFHVWPEGADATVDPFGPFTARHLARVRDIWVRARFTACAKDTGVCRDVMGSAYVPWRGDAVSVDLAPLADAEVREWVARLAKQAEPRERAVDLAFEAADSAYHAALDAGTPARFAEARAAALAADRPFVVVFSYEGCPPCIQLAREVLFAPDPPFALDDVDWVLVDTLHPDAGPLVQEYEAWGVPLLVRFDAQDAVAGSLRGYGAGVAAVQRFWERAARR